VIDEGLECEGCEKWFHPTCVKVESGIFEAIRDGADFGLHWMCPTCDLEFKTLLSNGFQKSLMDAISTTIAFEINKGMVALEKKILNTVRSEIGEGPNGNGAKPLSMPSSKNARNGNGNRYEDGT